MKKTGARQVKKVDEWRPIELPGLFLDAEDRRLAESLAGATGRRLVIDELRTGLRILAKSWVGVVHFSRFELHIVPKLAGDHLDLVRLIDFASGLDCLDRHPAVRDFQGDQANLLDLVALLLAEACEKLARDGLLADYWETEDDLPVMRGRLLVRKQMLKRFGRIDRLECRYDEHGTNVPENQLLLAALTACAVRVKYPSVALRVRRMVGVLHEAASLDCVDLRTLRTSLLYNRLNEHYREAHGLAWLVLDGLGIVDIFGGGSHRCFAFLLDMNRLFEDFIGRWLTQLLTGDGFRVRRQPRDRTILWDANRGEPYTSVIPDLLVEMPGQPLRCLPVDAKYKLYDERSISPADIYQTFLYAFAYGQHHALLPTALMLYPASSGSAGAVRLHVRQSGGQASAELRGLGIHIPSALSEATTRQVGAAATALCAILQEAFSMG